MPRSSSRGLGNRGFVLIQGTQQQIDDLHHDAQFEIYATRCNSSRSSAYSSLVGDGLAGAFGLYEDALRDAGV